jgi:superfamily II DNA/RNA helicase
LILDEADRMLEMGLSEDVMAIAKTCRTERQTLLFSATLEPQGIRHLIKQVVLGDAEEIVVNEVANSIEQQMILADDVKHKEKLLIALLEKSPFEKVVIFTNTKAKAVQLDNVLRYNKYKVSALHGDITQDQRRISLDFFRQGKTQVLVATDVAARGLDIPGVDLVINFDMAQSGDDYLHRIGRTGRADAEGRAVSFVAANDWNLTKGIERYLDTSFALISIPGLLGHYKGPDKLKSSGKAVGTKKKTDDKKSAADKEVKVKVRTKDKKNIGKRRAPSTKVEPAADFGDGFSVFKKKPQ